MEDEISRYLKQSGETNSCEYYYLVSDVERTHTPNERIRKIGKEFHDKYAFDVDKPDIIKMFVDALLKEVGD